MLILGIDPSLSGCAVCRCAIEPGDTFFRTARFTSKPTDTLRGRIARYQGLIGQLDEWLEGQPLILIEGYSFGSQGQAVLSLAEFGGLLRVELLRRGSDVIEVAPHALKKFATGKGNTKKEQVIAWVQKRWNVIHDTNDECDAFVLARIGMVLAGAAECDNETQREVIEKLRNPAVKQKRPRPQATGT